MRESVKLVIVNGASVSMVSILEKYYRYFDIFICAAFHVRMKFYPFICRRSIDVIFFFFFDKIKLRNLIYFSFNSVETLLYRPLKIEHIVKKQNKCFIPFQSLVNQSKKKSVSRLHQFV